MKFFETIIGSKDNSKNGVTQSSQSPDAYTVARGGPSFSSQGVKGGGVSKYADGKGCRIEDWCHAGGGANRG